MKVVIVKSLSSSKVKFMLFLVLWVQACNVYNKKIGFLYVGSEPKTVINYLQKIQPLLFNSVDPEIWLKWKLTKTTHLFIIFAHVKIKVLCMHVHVICK